MNPEKPFLYLIFGENKALLEDTGVATLMADGTRGTLIPTAAVIADLLAKWAEKKKHAPVSLIVIHSHSHSDHTAGDDQLKAMPNVQYVAPIPAEIQKAAGIANWPTDLGQIDLGGRVVDVIPFPGHDVASIALYDRRTGNLLTGDSLYSGTPVGEPIRSGDLYRQYAAPNGFLWAITRWLTSWGPTSSKRLLRMLTTAAVPGINRRNMSLNYHGLTF